MLNGVANDEGLSHNDLLGIAGQWGAPWYQDPKAGNGYPILQWQYDRGDYHEICGFDPESDPTGIEGCGTVKGLEGENVIYDLSGRRWSMVHGQWSMPKGIYIINGKKVIK